ncbi:MAG: peptidoglycan-binding protein, partial [Myxococcota bacterium]
QGGSSLLDNADAVSDGRLDPAVASGNVAVDATHGAAVAAGGTLAAVLTGVVLTMTGVGAPAGVTILLTTAGGLVGSLLTNWAWQESNASGLISTIVTAAVDGIPGAKALMRQVFRGVDAANDYVQNNIDSALFPDVIEPYRGATYPDRQLLVEIAPVELTEALLSASPPVEQLLYLQKLLVELGYLAPFGEDPLLWVSGSLYDGVTDNAIRAFQREHLRLLDRTGRLDAATLAKIADMAGATYRLGSNRYERPSAIAGLPVNATLGALDPITNTLGLSSRQPEASNATPVPRHPPEGQVLRRGDSGDWVAWVQQQLTWHGYPCYDEDGSGELDALGTFGRSTESALRRFQQARIEQGWLTRSGTRLGRTDDNTSSLPEYIWCCWF